jgi:hypothetical protein
LAGAICSIRAITNGRGNLGYDVLISGTILLPVGLFFPIAALLGPLNIEVIIIIYLLISCFIILILNSGFTRVVGLSDRGTILAVPATILITLWIVKVIMTSELLNTL